MPVRRNADGDVVDERTRRKWDSDRPDPARDGREPANRQTADVVAPTARPGGGPRGGTGEAGRHGVPDTRRVPGRGAGRSGGDADLPARSGARAGGGTNLTYVDDEPVLAPRELEPLAHVQMGHTVLRFVPLCGPGFSWEDEPDDR